jgi:hypothetical protein
VFRTLINDAKSAAASVVAKYAVRASVAVPFLVAAGFGTAALTLVLVERFGALTAYGIMGGGFAVLGLLAALAVTVKEQEEVVADAAAEQSDTAEVATDAAAQAAIQLPLALLGSFMTTPLGPGAALAGAKMIGRNLPLVVLLVLVGLMFWPPGEKAAAEEAPDASAPPEPDPAQWLPARNGMDRHAAV